MRIQDFRLPLHCGNPSLKQTLNPQLYSALVRNLCRHCSTRKIRYGSTTNLILVFVTDVRLIWCHSIPMSSLFLHVFCFEFPSFSLSCDFDTSDNVMKQWSETEADNFARHVHVAVITFRINPGIHKFGQACRGEKGAGFGDDNLNFNGFDICQKTSGRGADVKNRRRVIWQRNMGVIAGAFPRRRFGCT